MGQQQPFKAECSVRMMHVEYQGDNPGPVMRAVGDLIGGIIEGAASVATDRSGVGASGSQRTLEQLRVERKGPRASRPREIPRLLAHADAREDAEASVAGSADPVRDAAIRHLRELLCTYLTGLGVNATFQAVNFTTWLDATGQRPAPGSGIDLRCLGGMWSGLLRNGFIVAIGHQPDGGNPGTKHNSASRPIFRITRIPTP